MSKRASIVALLLAVACTVGAVLYFRKAQRLYYGKPLSYWLSTRHEGVQRELAIRAAAAAVVHDEDINRRRNAAKFLCLRGSGPGPETGYAVRALAAALKDSDPYVRTEAVMALGVIESWGEVAIPALVAALKDEQAWMRRSALYALLYLRVDWEANSAIGPLCEVLSDDDDRVREMAFFGLYRIGPEAKVAVPLLRDRLKDPESRIRVSAARALWRIDRQTDEAMPVLLEGLENPDKNVRCTAAVGLEEIGPGAKAAVSVLTTLLEDTMDELRAAAARALRKIDPEAADRAKVK